MSRHRVRIRSTGGLALVGVAACLSIFAGDGSAQAVLVQVLAAETSTPVVGALTYLVDGTDLTVKRTLADERGRALFVGIPAGSYRVRAEMIGMATAETNVLEVEAGGTITEVIRLEPSAIRLEGLDVELESGRCTVRPGAEGALVAELWDEARKALAAASFTETQDRYRYETVNYEREIDRETGVVLSEERNRRAGYMRTPYESHPAEDLVENGFVQDDGGRDLFMAPDAAVLLSDAFLDTHCFHVSDTEAGEGLVGLGFQPTGADKSVPDIAGILWMDRETAELQWLDYTYQYLEPERTSPQVGGRVEFERMPDGTWIVPEWWIRMPVMAVQTDFRDRRLTYIARFRQTGGLVVDMREAGGRALRGHDRTGGIEGVVRDSLGAPVQGVRVGVMGSNQEVHTNGSGEFGITGLPEGRYQVRVVAPSFEEGGFALEPVARDVIPGEMARLEYHMPSMASLLFDQCREVERDEGIVVLAGTVIDGLGGPVPDATVHVEWNAYDFSGVPKGRRARDLREIPHGLETTTDSRGSFSFCLVPAEAILRLRAATPTAASEELELVIPEFEIGAVRTLQLSRR